jgi:hypothetical protein
MLYGLRALRCPLLLDEVQPRAMLFLHLFCRNNFAAKICQPNKLFLYRLQPVTPPSVGDLGFGALAAVAPKLFIQFLNVSNLFPQMSNLFSKNQ